MYKFIEKYKTNSRKKLKVSIIVKEADTIVYNLPTEDRNSCTPDKECTIVTMEGNWAIFTKFANSIAL